MSPLATAGDSEFLTLKSVAALVHVAAVIVWLFNRKGRAAAPAAPKPDPAAELVQNRRALKTCLDIFLALALGMAGRYGLFYLRGKWKPEHAEDLAGVLLVFVVPAIIQYVLCRALLAGSRSAGLLLVGLTSLTALFNAALLALFYLAREEVPGGYWLFVTALTTFVAAGGAYFTFLVWRGTATTNPV